MTERAQAGGGRPPDPAAMGRRDFLLLRRRGPERVLELSCERLYMRWADARSGAGRGPAAPASATPTSRLQPWDGEPATEIDRAGPAELFRELERGLAQVGRLRLLDREWMHDADFASELDARIDAFRARGGAVE